MCLLVVVGRVGGGVVLSAGLVRDRALCQAGQLGLES